VLDQARLDDVGRERLLREARATANLDHPNIISVHDAGEAGGVPFIVMQYFAGKNLHEVVANPTHESSEARTLPIVTPPMERGISLPQAIEIIIQVCRALEHAHQHGIIHRDVKPENVIVVKEGEHWTARLTDFGLARSLASRRTAEGTIIGTVFYMAPEQALGQAVDGRTDLYALGVMLYELTTGSLPFTGDDPLAVLSQHLNAPLKPPRTHNPEIPIALDTLICRLMAKKPEDRPVSAADVCLALEELAQPALAPQGVGKPRHNLPTSITTFIGREKQIEAVANLLRNHRLATITGTGGVGKTRLGIEVARRMLPDYPDGVWLVELGPLDDPALVPHTVTRSLWMGPTSSEQVLPSLLDYLENRHLLLVLDNCEHVVEACARLADQLLPECAQLSILVTSREPLGITGEAIFHVPPLTVPQARQLPPLESLSQYEAIQLFVERAATTSPGFTLTPASAPAVAQVCQRLDGIPLAIEMAAARTRMLQVEEIASRLADRFQLLTSGSRTGLPRHQTLRACLDWSYDLLSDAERALLQRLSVFTGGWVLEAAEAVGCGEGIQGCDVPELLGMLVDKSLVQVSSEAADLSRYRMLETIRQYAHEQLVETGQAEAARNRHLIYYLELAERVGGKIRGPDEAVILERLEAELDNLRLALAWSLEGKDRPAWDPEPGLGLAAALMWFWRCRGRSDEGTYWLEQLLSGEAEERGSRPFTTERIQQRAKALQVASWLAACSWEPQKARNFAAESRALYQSLGAGGRVGYAYASMYYDFMSDNFTEHIKVHEQALATLREAGDRFGEGEFLGNLGNYAFNLHDYNKAKAYWDENLALRKEIGDLEGLAIALYGQIRLARNNGEFRQARALAEESIRILSTVNSIGLVGLMNIHLSSLYMYEGNYEQSAAHAREALSIGRRQGDSELIYSGLVCLGDLASNQENYQEATEAFEEALDYFRKKDHKLFIADTQIELGYIALARRDFEQAWHRITDALTNYPEIDPSLKASALTGLGKVALAKGETRQAGVYFQQALGIHHLGNSAFNHILDGLSALAAAQGQDVAAARLLGASDTWHTRYYHGIYPHIRQEREACIAAVRAAIGEQAFTAAFAEGQAMTREQVVEYARKV
jgi:predicted ATPase/tRNA A-37 threonylcarbamoyl transferase component Bud32